jgi:hypothetical protein
LIVARFRRFLGLLEDRIWKISELDGMSYLDEFHRLQGMRIYYDRPLSRFPIESQWQLDLGTIATLCSANGLLSWKPIDLNIAQPRVID